MKTTVNWSKLFIENRVKAIGVPWTKEDRVALKSGISPEDIRAGILTKKEVEKADEKDSKSKKANIFRMTKVELVKEAKAKGIKFDIDSTPRSALIAELSKKKSDK